MLFRCFLILGAALCLNACSLVTTPLGVAGGLAGATVKATGGVAAAGVKAIGRDGKPVQQPSLQQQAPGYPPQQGYYYQQPYPQQAAYPPPGYAQPYPQPQAYPYPPQQQPQGYWHQGRWYPYAPQR